MDLRPWLLPAVPLALKYWARAQLALNTRYAHRWHLNTRSACRWHLSARHLNTRHACRWHSINSSKPSRASFACLVLDVSRLGFFRFRASNGQSNQRRPIEANEIFVLKSSRDSLFAEPGSVRLASIHDGLMTAMPKPSVCSASQT